LNKYFRYENREFIEYEHVPCGYINPTKECLVLSIMEDTSRPKIERIGLFIKKQNIQNVYLDFISTESYIDVNTYKRLEAELSGFNFKILTVNILNCQFKSHIFFPLHALQLLHSFGDKIESINYIQDTNLSSKKRLKKYLFLNHHLRTERFKIFESLYNNNKLNDGLVSFCWNMEHEEFNPQWYDVNKNDIEYIKNSNAYNILPLELDGMNENKSKYFEVKNEIQNPRYFSPPNTNISHYFNIYFEIVTEGFSSRTPFHPYADRSNILHYSEKIYKPILFGVPFCFWGPENTLEYFSKEFGMTFNCPLYYCNVGYDLNEFCDKVNELSNLSYLELHKLYYEYFDEIRNNQQILIRYLKNIQL
jgi:hypothetical protein